MSTNFYMHYYPNGFGDYHNPVTPVLQFHIGKRVSTGLSTMNGSVFPTVEAWKTFMTHNINYIEVRDEYGALQDTKEFMEKVMVPNSENQYNWLIDNGYTVHDAPVPPKPYSQNGWDNWMDGDQLFYNGHFS